VQQQRKKGNIFTGNLSCVGDPTLSKEHVISGADERKRVISNVSFFFVRERVLKELMIIKMMIIVRRGP